MGLDKLTNAFGLLILFRGAAAIVGSPLAGAVYDATQSYSIPFFMAGFFFFVSTVTSFMAPFMKRCTTPEVCNAVREILVPLLYRVTGGSFVETREVAPANILYFSIS